jgi:hypothetical protein
MPVNAVLKRVKNPVTRCSSAARAILLRRMAAVHAAATPRSHLSCATLTRAFAAAPAVDALALPEPGSREVAALSPRV